MNDKEFEIFLEAHEGLSRQGPGSNELTKQALYSMKDVPLQPVILDIGCGSGMQTLELARNLDCTVTAVDLFQLFLNELKIRAEKENLLHKIKTLNKSMFELDFEAESFDIIWAEGSIYIYGFEKGLKDWSKFLKKGGYIAITECSWLREEISPEPQKYWQENYPAMKTVRENLEIIKNQGLEVINHFTLPEEAWENYYLPLKSNLEKIALKYGQEADRLIEEQCFEIDLYNKYSKEYGYEFYIIKKPL